MARIIRRLSIDRRSFLRGSGAAIALPFLESMVPALTTPGAANHPTRCAFIFAPNGKRMEHWTPKTKGSGFEWTPSRRALAPVKDQVLVLSGLTIDGGRAQGDGPGDHARAAASFLTCAHPRKTGGSDIHAGKSIDQVIAEAIGQETAIASLELGMDGGRRAGTCDSGYSCAYSNTIAWKSPTTPIAKETRAGELFRRLFGDPDDLRNEAARQRRLEERKSILDFILDDAKSLRTKLPGVDRAKLDEYLDAVRALERRIDDDQAPRTVEGAERLLARGGDRRDRMQRMFDLIALAFQADLVRTVTFMLGNAGSNVSHRFLGVSEGHHDTSHHGKATKKLDDLSKIDAFHVGELARFLEGLQSIDDGGKSLLERSMILYGSGLGDGNGHHHHDLPILLCGGGNGKLRSGRHIVYPKDTPMADLYLSMLDKLGLETKSFADSRGRLSEI
ncbi:MAG: DUF1552 domain-containing protein [Planctomycetes bacterium]|nr:DUF1552 domain-containing protein [Planctomycetota bacterium]